MLFGTGPIFTHDFVGVVIAEVCVVGGGIAFGYLFWKMHPLSNAQRILRWKAVAVLAVIIVFVGALPLTLVKPLSTDILSHQISKKVVEDLKGWTPPTPQPPTGPAARLHIVRLETGDVAPEKRPFLIHPEVTP